MLRRIDLRGAAIGPATAGLLPRAAVDVDAASELVRPLCADVRERGDAAVREATLRYDGVAVDDLRVPVADLHRALAELPADLRAALAECARRARLVHEAQRRTDVVVDVGPGARVTERYVPVARVGLYVPGGRVAYPSSVVMNVVPAQVAGVSSIAVASPPKTEFGGRPHPAILAACALLGIEEVYRVGGAQAVAMLAYGTETVARVDLVTGPGNVYVAAAKRAVRGVAGIDAEAGPTEIGIIADASALAPHVAADLLAQAEHDPNAACLLVTDSPELADEVDRCLDLLVPAAGHRDVVETALSAQSATAVVDHLDAASAVMDLWAPEHLEMLTVDAAERARRVRNAGAVFVGTYSPVSLGDYLAGSNHVLPTGGTARHTAGLSVDTFVRGVHVVEYDEAALAETAAHIAVLGAAEDLPAHVAAVNARTTGSGR
ncbi:MAG TPA: histidinol dehydrogenase [Mycobacteriales bacterium]|nr:histidinol dehydrogenase [Mycobacteriales bacterium]